MDIYTLVLGPYATNTYIVIDNGEAVVVDPADRADHISARIEAHCATLKFILITHGHFDHISAVGELKSRYPEARIVMTESDYSVVKFNRSGGVFDVPSAPFGVDVYVKDGDRFLFIGHEFKIVHTPGHTLGGVCYILDDEVIFSGDTLFRSSIGRSDFIFGDSAELIKSVKKLYELRHDYKILPGHGPSTMLDYERKYNAYVNN